MSSVTPSAFFTALVLATAGTHAETETALPAAYQEALARSHSQWIEVDSGRSASRAFLATANSAGLDGTKRVHLRYDRAQTSKELGPATLVRTVDLDCRHSQARLIALHGFDQDGQQLFSKTTEDQKLQTVLNFYDSPLRLVCTGEYLQPLVQGGASHYDQARHALRDEARAAVPDRSIPLME